jgi:beta-lactamase regulating signal transducer with metallopeptidase domain
MSDLGNLAVPLAHYLAHSLWQGPVVLVAYLLLRRRLAASGTGASCRVTTAGIILLILLPLLTALATLATGGSDAPTLPAGPVPNPLVPVPVPLLRLFQTHFTLDLARTITLIWCMGVLLSLGQVLTGVWRINRMLARAGRPVAPARLASLAARAGLAKPPAVREWSGTTAPFVVGWREPVVVLPVGLQTLLPASELEAVLLHELAHVRRGDVRANLVLRVLGAFGWHQAALWRMMGDLAREREHCCDELAVMAMGRTLPLARALLTLEECRSGQPRLAMAGTGGDFAARVRRIIAGGTMAGPPTRRRAGAAMAGLLAVTVVTMLLAASMEGELEAWANRVHALVQANDPAGPFTVELIGGRLVAATIDGASVPAERIVQRGHQVRLLDAAGRPELTLDVRAPGTIHWRPRLPRSP